MPEAMSALLTKVPKPKEITPKRFAEMFGDDDFNGSATKREMVAFWQLAYDCINFSTKSSDRSTAVFAMLGFTEIPSSTLFPKLDRNIVMFQMILRLMKPERVNQREFGICGPAHFIVLLIKSRPIKYVSMAMDLLTKGRTTGEDGFEIIPDKYVMEFEPEGSIPQADWLLAASLRNSQTPIPPGKERGEYGGTKSPDVFAYCLHAGYSEIASVGCYKRASDWLAHTIAPSYYEQYHPDGLRKDLAEKFGNLSDPENNFRMACWLRNQGWRVMLKTNGDLFHLEPVSQSVREKAATGNPFSQQYVTQRDESRKAATSEKTLGGIISMQNVNHWVLAKKIELSSGVVKLNVYTWGGQQSLKIDLTMDEFSNSYAGFVAARG